MTEASFDPGMGALVASAAAIDALRRLGRGEELTGGEGDPAGHEELERAGALRSGAPHPALEPTLDAVAAPVCEAALARGDRRARVWVDARVSVLLVPEPDGRLKLGTVPTPFLPLALARVNGLGPRPRIEPAVRLSFSAGDLARLLAERDLAAVWSAAPDTPETAAARALVRGLREHWRVEVRWAPAPDSPGVRAVEVIDTDAGLWLVVPDDPGVELWPTSPTTVFRRLAALLPATEELDAEALRQGL